MNSTLPTSGAWPWLMSDALSALPDAPVVDAGLARSVGAGQRAAAARVLRRLAELVEPRYGPQPLPDTAAPC